MKKYKFKQSLWLVILGAFAGFVNGFFGAGAGLILVPAIKEILKLDEKKVHATTVGCVMSMSSVCLVVYLIKKQINFGLAIWCLIGSVIGAIVGTILLQKLKNKVLNIVFSGVLILAGVAMIVF